MLVVPGGRPDFDPAEKEEDDDNGVALEAGFSSWVEASVDQTSLMMKLVVDGGSGGGLYYLPSEGSLLLLHWIMMKEAAEPGYDGTHAPPPLHSKRLNEGPATETGHVRGGGAVHHITVEVSDLVRSREWYQRSLPVCRVARKVQSPLHGEWY